MSAHIVGRWLLLLVAVLSRVALAGSVSTAATATEPLCTVEKVQEICAPASQGASSVIIDCSIDFSQLDCVKAAKVPNIITRKLLFHGASASRVQADFNHALIDAGPGQFNHGRRDIIEIASINLQAGQWSVPTDIQIKRATVAGSIRVFGMGRNGEAELVRQSSHQPGHRDRIRGNAPSRIHLSDLHIQGGGRSPVYFSPGVTDSTLEYSTISGFSDRVAVYLDTESNGISLKDNVFDVRTTDASVLGFYDRGWPQIAIDGSSDNHIVSNIFKRADEGGIFLYRNCGEGGTVRFSSPSRNVIKANHFLRSSGSSWQSPVIFIGSRNYGMLENLLPGWHCNDDQIGEVQRRLAGDDAASSATSNADHAQHNRVIANLFTRNQAHRTDAGWIKAGDLIRIGNARLDRHNLIRKNRWLD